MMDDVVRGGFGKWAKNYVFLHSYFIPHTVHGGGALIKTMSQRIQWRDFLAKPEP